MPARPPRALCKMSGDAPMISLPSSRILPVGLLAAARQQLQQRQRRQRFAGPGLADQRQGFTAIEIERHVIDHAFGTERDREMLNLQQTHAVGSRLGSNASRTASPMKISKVRTPPSTTNAVMPSHGACRFDFA